MRHFQNNCLILFFFYNAANYAGLFSASEMQSVAAQMSIGGAFKMSSERVDATFQKFLLRVRSNLHVVVCLRYSGAQDASSYLN
jgi:hypothetical protein